MFIASGIANGAGSRDQESTGEAINAYYGALLWATVTGNTDMVNYVNLLRKSLVTAYAMVLYDDGRVRAASSRRSPDTAARRRGGA